MRKGFSFIEIMIVVVIASLMIMLTVQWQARFSGMFASNVADLALQSDTRVLFDYLSSDLTGAILTATGKGEKLEDFDWNATGADQTLQVIKLKKDPKGRHVSPTDPKKPQYEGYPTFTDNGDPTVQKWPAFRVLYETEKDPQSTPDKLQIRVWRTEEEGTFQRQEAPSHCDSDPAWTYTFSGHPTTRRELKASRVSQWAILPLAFLPKPPTNAPAPQNQPATPDPNASTAGLIPPDHFLAQWKKDKPCAQLYHIAALGVHFVAEDVKIGAKGNEGKVELVCKYWMEERSANYRFNTAFSSVDENL